MTTLQGMNPNIDVNDASGSIYFIGNATVLIRCAGFTILTDPTFIHMHEQVSIGYGHAQHTSYQSSHGDLRPTRV